MGGSVNVAVRSKDGSMKMGASFTNSLPAKVRHPLFIAQDPAHLADLVDEEGSVLAPDGYGLIVFDAKTDTVLSMQSYSSLEERTSDFARNVFEGLYEDGGAELALLASLANEGRLSLSWIDGDGPQASGPLSLHEVKAALKGDRPKRRLSMLRYDLRPWTFAHFDDETAEGAREMRDALARLGFPSTAEDQAAWMAWIDERAGA